MLVNKASSLVRTCVLSRFIRELENHNDTHIATWKVLRVSKRYKIAGQEKRVSKSSRRILYFFETRMTLYKLRIEYFNSLMLLVTWAKNGITGHCLKCQGHSGRGTYEHFISSGALFLAFFWIVNHFGEWSIPENTFFSGFCSNYGFFILIFVQRWNTNCVCQLGLFVRLGNSVRFVQIEDARGISPGLIIQWPI